mgnify:CR=1 FL=1
MSTQIKSQVDPITLEIIRNLLIAILDEGEINLSRTVALPRNCLQSCALQEHSYGRRR